MEYKLDFDVIMNDPLRTIEFGPSWTSKTCTQCLVDKRIDNYYTIESGRGMFSGYVSVGKCKACWNNAKTFKPRGFKNIDAEKQEKALHLIATTRKDLKAIAKECEIPYTILSHYMRTKDLTPAMKKEIKAKAPEMKKIRLAKKQEAAEKKIPKLAEKAANLII
jgi:hypothetical protein